MMEFKMVAICGRRSRNSLPGIEAAWLDARNATSSATPRRFAAVPKFRKRSERSGHAESVGSVSIWRKWPWLC